MSASPHAHSPPPKHTWRDCARLHVPPHPPTSDVHLASHLLCGEGGNTCTRAVSLVSRFSHSHIFPTSTLHLLPASWRYASPLNPAARCWPHHVAKAASLEASLFPNTDFFFFFFPSRPHPAASPSAREGGCCVHVPCLQSSLLSFLSWFCSSFSIVPSLLRPLPSLLGCFERPMLIFSENSVWKLSGNSLHPQILVLGLAPGMPSDSRRSPCRPDSPAVGFLPLCHALFSLKCLASPALL